MSLALRRGAAALLFASANGMAAAQTVDVTITDAKIAGGKLVVTGTTRTARMALTLNDQFDTTSNGSKAFSYSLVYLPPDCIVNVGKTGAAATTPGVVANCAARGLNAQGAWNRNTAYVANDVVTQLGSVWRALEDNKNKSPSVQANAALWEKFVSKGDAGTAGPKGDQGDQGAAGATGSQGTRGEQGLQGAKGDKGDKGDQGNAGTTGPIGMTWSGTWDSETGYVVNNVVQLGGKSFIAVANSTGESPLTTSGFWNIVVSGLRPRGAYAGGTTYAFGDVVTLGGSSYMSLQGSNTGNDPASSAAFWSMAASKGDTGAKGDRGDQGNAGAKGDTGNAGAKGDTGNAGAKGDTGNAGAKGDTGNAGAKGDTGNAGIQGAKGDKGDKGDPGNAGAQGATGATGIVSVTSLDGRAMGGFIANAFVFVGPVATISVASGQKVTFHASAWLIGGSGQFYYGLCKRMADFSAVPISTWYKGEIDGSAQVSATGTISGLAADSYDVGFCGRTISAFISTSMYDPTADGWVMVHY